MKGNLFKTLFSMLFGIILLMSAGITASADAAASKLVLDVIGPVEAIGGLVLILGAVSLVITIIAVVVIVCIRKKNAR